MSSYIVTILTGFAVFPFLAILFTLPYALHQYHKYGSVSKYRTLIIYSFVLYLLIAYFMVTLPLPDPASTVGNRWQDHLSLIPFRGIIGFWTKNGLSPNTVREFLKSHVLWQVLFNFLLTVPFGVYLRYYFKQSFGRTVLYSFLLSLSFELTQLTALWGIYPGPYRLADVEDLITNTSGGAIGWQIAYVFTKILPDRDAIDAWSRKAGKQITGKRRFWASLFDYLCCNVILIFINVGWRLLFEPKESPINGELGLWTVFCILGFLQTVATKGVTLGHATCRMMLVSEDGSTATRQQLARRYLWLWIFTELPIVAANYLVALAVGFFGYLAFFVVVLLSRTYFIMYFVNEVLRSGVHPMPHDKLSGTTYVAIEVPQSDAK